MTAPVIQPAGVERRLSDPWTVSRIVRIALIAAAIIGGFASLRFLEFNLVEMYRGIGRSGYLEAAFPPKWGGEFRSSLSALWRTMLMAAAGTGLAAVFAFPVGILAAQNLSPHPTVRAVARGFIVFCRATPELVFAVVFVLVVSIGEKPGVVALGLHSIGMLGKMLADRLEEIDEKPREAALAAGGSRWQAIANAAFPQVIPNFVNVTVYRFDINLRAAAVIGLVGGGGIGQLIAGNLQNRLRYPVGWAQALLLAVVILVVDMLSTRLRGALAGIESRNVTELRLSQQKALKSGARSLRAPWTRDRVVTSAASWSMVVIFLFSMYEIGLTPFEIVRMLWGAIGELPRYVPPSFNDVSYQIARDGSQALNFDAYRAAVIDTIAIATGAAFIAIVLAVPTGFLIARTTTKSAQVSGIVRTLLASLRALPDLALVLFLTSLVGLASPFPAAAALAIGLFAFLAKLIADDLDGLGSHAQEALRAAGATHRQEVIGGVLPAAVPMLVSHCLYALDIAVRGTLLLGVFTGVGIGWVFTQTNFLPNPYPAIAACVLTIYALVVLIEALGLLVRRYLI